MLPRKKLEYYARQHGIEKLSDVKLTDEDCERICKAVGFRVIRASEIRGDIGILIAVVMDDPAFVNAHRREGQSEEMLLIRCGDYAADECFRAYVSK